MTKYKDIKVGDILVADAGFDCLFDGQKCVVEEDAQGIKFIYCTEGPHYLDGQLEFHAPPGEERLIGLTLLETTAK